MLSVNKIPFPEKRITDESNIESQVVSENQTME